ncbi:hypothetical protein BGM19_34320 [Streptomyces agglomeratus]|uniref:PPOX class F420-dependent oxidoreductase n=1 Tax=Streptomyces agglomeratus TaxID=285458 RepID=UPI00086C84B4|nr:PPOX class F420-dependent oxidoreductase [Streptomyces agglomeratus]OEJ62338.1 hypothetical protein BGM19_34320 [Streptomyces agglomeratus]
MPFTDPEREYLLNQPLGRLATLGPDGGPQVRPVLFELNLTTGTIDIGGWDMAATQKFRNVRTRRQVSFIVDDVVSTDPYLERGVEIRGRAQPVPGHGPLYDGCSADIIRVHPCRIVAWGLDCTTPVTLTARDVLRTR